MYRSSFEEVKKFHVEVEDAAVRLEELLMQKKKKMMQAARVHALETETHEVFAGESDAIASRLMPRARVRQIGLKRRCTGAKAKPWNARLNAYYIILLLLGWVSRKMFEKRSKIEMFTI